ATFSFTSGGPPATYRDRSPAGDRPFTQRDGPCASGGRGSFPEYGEPPERSEPADGRPQPCAGEQPSQYAVELRTVGQPRTPGIRGQKVDRLIILSESCLALARTTAAMGKSERRRIASVVWEM